jgi:hypothetical protein
MKETDHCPISGDTWVRRPTTGDYLEYNCPTCGRFRVTRTAMKLAGEKDQGLLREALQVAKHSTRPGEVPIISNLSG